MVLWGDATREGFFLDFLINYLSLWGIPVLWMMKWFKEHLKTVPSYNLLQAEVLHHIYNVKLEAPGFIEGRNTYLTLAYNDTYPVSLTF